MPNLDLVHGGLDTASEPQKAAEKLLSGELKKLSPQMRVEVKSLLDDVGRSGSISREAVNGQLKLWKDEGMTREQEKVIIEFLKVFAPSLVPDEKTGTLNPPDMKEAA